MESNLGLILDKYYFFKIKDIQITVNTKSPTQ